MKKEFVTLDETMNLLKFMNSDDQAFQGRKFVNESNQQESLRVGGRVTNDLPRISPASSHKEDENDKESVRKTLNKNRAIKRIIDSSKEILINNITYEEPLPNENKSYVTRFSIHIKQRNRIREEIERQKELKEEEQNKYRTNEENRLERKFFFTVVRDFREILDVSLLKNRIEKNNVEMMMDTFKKCLIVLNSNELQIFDDENELVASREIKFYEFQTVDYLVQPYIFIVITVVEDRSLGAEYLYLRFDSQERQKKWDFALYCNYSTKKMKRKNKLFLQLYPEEADKPETNEGKDHSIEKREDIKSFEIDQKRIIRNIMEEKSREREELVETNPEKNYEHYDRMNSDKTNKNLSPSRETIAHTGYKTTEQKQFFESTNKKRKVSNHDLEKNSDANALHKLNSIKDSANDSKHNTNLNSPTNIEKEYESQEHHENIFTVNKVESEDDPSGIKESRASQQIITAATRRRIELKEKHKNGMLLKKPKFFSETPKLVFFGVSEMDYWDIDEATLNKSNKKTVLFSNIKNIRIKEKNSLMTIELENKKLEFTGNLGDMNDLIEWIELQKAHKDEGDGKAKVETINK